MTRFLPIGFAIAMTFGSLSTAGAGPIAYSLYGGNGGQNYGILPDLNAGGTVAFQTSDKLPWDSLGTSPAVGSTTFDVPLDLEIRYFPAGAPADYAKASDPGDPAIKVVFQVQGTETTSTNNDRGLISLTTSLTSVSPATTSLREFADEADLPAPILDLLQHPERIHLSSPEQVGWAGFEPTLYLTIDPASAPNVPEPATIAAFAALAGGLVLRRRRGGAALLR